MTSTTASRRHLIVVLFLTALGIAVAVVGTAPLVFLIWMLRGMPHWLSF
ncbi:hypothetical protein [Agrobacterium larrymoorei]|uniref:Uncharacterized protein n=1 Tax=Agrobacterium larrymoorei TaxID=160699 RepID=A0AAF0HE70_9HYPH|nr:hypothetical protein [Agrobacterium larrymoorei]QYA09819.1 hypothetical protein J5285_20920 [Agrobacterium larrymoorei]WHA42741.1 hypothetical protein CFBP5477_015825 [Agrobacterium larrymoorei]